MTPTYSCDFETNVQPEYCWVWAWIAIDIKSEKKIIGNSIESFLEWCFTGQNKICYFHNLKFDGEFIISELLKTGYTHKQEKNIENAEFTTLISDKGQFYSMKVQNNDIKVTFKDSLKVLPFSVAKIAKDFHLDIEKLEIDYKEFRPKGHILTEEEEHYITNDALIIARALKELFAKKMTKLTIGSNAFSFYKKQKGGDKNFRKLFPVLDCDAYIRKAYKGGFTYAAPQYQDKRIGVGRVYDVNSLYPYVMHSPHIYPYGKPIYFNGKYEQDDKYPLYFQRIACNFELKPNHIPTIQIKKSRLFMPTEYLTTSGNNEVELTLTNVDLQLFFDHYDVYNLIYIDGYKFMGASGLFDDYIDTWYNNKRTSKEDNNYSMYQISKLMLNSLYGKFATNPKVASKVPYLDSNGIVRYQVTEPEEREPVYIPVGAFCTAYARNKTIRAAQSCYERFLYADTDSLHLLGDYDDPDLDVDDYKLGYWKHESTFSEAKYIRAKMYMEKLRSPYNPPGTEKWNVTGAGMTDACKEKVTIDTFKIGGVFEGKLKVTHCPGGVVLTETPFTIRQK